MSSSREAVIVGGNRIPFARSNRQYAEASNYDMLLATLNGLSARYGLAGTRIGEVVGGAVLKHSKDFNLVRDVVLSSALGSDSPAFDIQKACDTSLEATVAIANKIKLGQIESGIACGVDTTSDAPVAVSDGLRSTLMAANRASGPMDYVKLLGTIRPGDLVPDAPQNSERHTGMSMGEHQAITTKKWDITREAQDELALASHQNLAAAYDAGFFDDLVTSFLGVSRDTNLRADSSLEALAKLKPAFGGPNGTMTAGNCTPLTDGAAAVLLSTPDWAAERNLTPLARFIDAESGAVDHVLGEDGLLMAPVYAVPRLLERNGLTLNDFDRFEIHEAFAATVLCTLEAWEDEAFCQERLGLDSAFGSVDRTKLNVNGSSLATGHPFAATGARIVATTAKMLSERDDWENGGRALVSICAAGGNGLVAIIEK